MVVKVMVKMNDQLTKSTLTSGKFPVDRWKATKIVNKTLHRHVQGRTAYSGGVAKFALLVPEGS
jgi:hypothetical protein